MKPQPIRELERSGERAEHVRAVDSAREALRVAHWIDEEAILGREKVERASRVAHATKWAVEQRLIPHERANSDIASTLRRLNPELKTESLVDVSDVNRGAGTVESPRGRDARLIQVP